MEPVPLQYTRSVVIEDGVKDVATKCIFSEAVGVLDWICDFEDDTTVSGDETDIIDDTDVISVKECGILIWIGDFVGNTTVSTGRSDMVDKLLARWHVEQHT